MTKLFLIRIKQLENEHLFVGGWRAGDWVRSVYTPYGYRFERCHLGETTAYDSREGAEVAVRDKGRHFVGCSFEVVEFRSTT